MLYGRFISFRDTSDTREQATTQVTQLERQTSETVETRVHLQSDRIRWAWACRLLHPSDYRVDRYDVNDPQVGDLALVRVDQIGHRNTIVDINNKNMRIYPDDLFVGVFGNRYATDQMEAEVTGLNDLGLLTSAGMIGTVKSVHHNYGRPTRVSFQGFITNSDGTRINLKRHAFRPTPHAGRVKNLALVVGTGMNSGKTTAAARLIKQLHRRGLKVAFCKVTGSVSNRDQDEMRAASAKPVVDFSDYGFPSTYLSSKEELLDLFNLILTHMERSDPDLVVMEIADGILQQETSTLLSDPTVKNTVKGVVLAADSALSALYAVDRLKANGYKIIGVTGKITSSPLYVREFSKNCDVPVGSSAGAGKDLGNLVASFVFPETADAKE
ncbi:AAA family ATPase [Candidatus Bathyarchaeota archaeon]|nr:AAA family ATPase [Candidatus Bathyarchaeota archaeon]